MQEEKDLIEINLNTPTEIPNGKGFNYFGNISFARNFGTGDGFPYGQCRNECENIPTAISKDNSKLYGLSFTDADQRPDKLTCLRQMYCPDCQQRLDEDSVLLEKHGLCCVPLFSINRWYQNCLKRYGNRRIYCRNCGGHMGYWKQR